MPFNHFDFIAPHYDSLFRFDRLEKILSIIGLPAGGTLLDAGGGTGRVAEVLRPHIDQVIVADLSMGMLSQAHGKGLPAVCTPTERLPFPDDFFERVLMVDALHHVYNQAATARELWRVLKPGGRLVIEEPDIRRFSVKLVALAEKLALMRSRIVSARRISNLFAFDNATIKLDSLQYTVWVVVEKEAGAAILA